MMISGRLTITVDDSVERTDPMHKRQGKGMPGKQQVQSQPKTLQFTRRISEHLLQPRQIAKQATQVHTLQPRRIRREIIDSRTHVENKVDLNNKWRQRVMRVGLKIIF